MLSKNQIDSYKQNGYLGVEDVLSESEVNALRQTTDKFVEQSQEVSVY